jgi:hypothetical protein
MWARDGTIPEPTGRALAARYVDEQRALQAEFDVAQPEPAAATAVGTGTAATTATTIGPALPPAAAAAPEPPRAQPIEAASLPRPQAPARQAAETARAAPLRPAFSWELLWRALLSERALEAMLYVGAFLIVAAGATLVYLNWGSFSPVLQLLILAAGTASFFAFGWLLRTRWRLMQSGSAFVGIGALIVPVDFFAWARFRHLPPDAYPAMWLLASLFCVTVYGATARWLRGRFFLVITLLAVESLVLAIAHLLRLPPAWWPTVATALACAWIAVGPRWEHTGVGFGRATHMTATIIAASAILTAAWLRRNDWSTVLSVNATVGSWVLPVATAMWSGAVFAVLITSVYPSLWGATVAACLPAVAAVLTLAAVIPIAWLSLVLLLLAPLYTVTAPRLRVDLRAAAQDTGVGLSIAALAWALVDARTMSVVYLAATAVFAWWAIRFERPWLTSVAQAVLLAGLVRGLDVVRVGLVYWPLAALAAGLLGIAAARWTPLPRQTQFLYAGAYVQITFALATAVVFASPRAVLVAVVGGAAAVALYSAQLSRTPAAPVLEALWMLDIPAAASLFHWAAAALIAAEMVLAWTWRYPDAAWLPAAGIVLSTVFVTVGRRLAPHGERTARPWVMTAHALGAGMLMVVLDRAGRIEIAATLFLAAAAAALWARLLDSPVHAHLGAWLALPACGVLLPEALARGLLPSRVAFAWPMAGLATLYLGVGVLLDRLGPRFSASAHAVGHALMPLALLWAIPDRNIAVWTTAVAALFYGLSAWLAHADRYPAFARLVQRVAGVPQGGDSPFRAVFVYAAAWLLAVWCYLAFQYAGAIGGSRERLGLAVSLLAWLYLIAGQRLGRLRAHYVAPMRIAAQALVVLGGMMTALVRPMLIASVASGAALQIALYRLSGQVVWVYTAAIGGAALLGLVLRAMGAGGAEGGWAMVALAIVYLAVAQAAWTRSGEEQMPPASFALFAVAYLATGIGVLLSALRTPGAALIAYVLAMGVFLWSGLRLREPLLGYPVAGLAAAAYVSALVIVLSRYATLRPTYGLWMIPGIIVLLALAGVLESRGRARGLALLGAAWAGPFYVGAHVGVVAMLGLAAGDPRLLPVAFAAGAAAYAVSAAFLRTPIWLYPALFCAHGAVLLGLVRLHVDPHAVPAAFVPVAWLLAAIGRRVETTALHPSTEWRDWAAPWQIAAAANVVVWELVAAIDARVLVLTSLGFAVLMAGFAQWRTDHRLASISLGLIVVAVGAGLRRFSVPYPTALLSVSGLALLFEAGRLVLSRAGRGALWETGLRLFAVLTSSLAIVIAVVGVATNTHPKAGEGLVATLSVVGLVYLLVSVADRREWLGYLGVAMLEVAWAIFLLEGLKVTEPQWYAIPVALYLLGVGAVERRLGRRARARAGEIAGLALLFGSALAQSLAPDGFRYAALLAAEGLLAAWTGIAYRLRHYFFGGIALIVVNVIAQLIDPLRSLDKTVLFLALGLLLVVTAVAAERKRDEIMQATRAWRTRLEAWE